MNRREVAVEMLVKTQILQNKFIEAPVAAAALAKKPSILVLVHGRGGKWNLMEWLSKRFKIPGLDYICIQAPFDEDVPEMKSPGFSWYLKPRRKGLEKSRDLLESFISELLRSGYSADSIYWLGFSQGGVMGLDLALRGSHKLGGFICVSGFCIDYDKYPEELGPHAKNQKILCTHGSRDEIVSFDRAKESYDHLVNLGINLKFQEYSKPHSFELAHEIPFLESQLIDWMN